MRIQIFTGKLQVWRSYHPYMVEYTRINPVKIRARLIRLGFACRDFGSVQIFTAEN